MEKLLIVVDMQTDFVNGSLGTPEAQAIVPKVREKILAHKGPVIFTRDMHEKNYPETQEGRFLPVPHCIRGTEGCEIIPELKALSRRKGVRIIDKPSFGSTVLAALVSEQRDRFESIELIGLCTDICVVSNALLIKAVLPEMPLYVDADCCAGVTPESHKAALTTMKFCQITIRQEEKEA